MTPHTFLSALRLIFLLDLSAFIHGNKCLLRLMRNKRILPVRSCEKLESVQQNCFMISRLARALRTSKSWVFLQHIGSRAPLHKSRGVKLLGKPETKGPIHVYGKKNRPNVRASQTMGCYTRTQLYMRMLMANSNY